MASDRLYSILNSRSRELLRSALCSSSSIVQSVFLDSSYICYTFVGFNTIYGDYLIIRDTTHKTCSVLK